MKMRWHSEVARFQSRPPAQMQTLANKQDELIGYLHRN